MSTRRSVVFIGSECYPFVKTGGLGDVMYALPRALVSEGCEVRVILPLYACCQGIEIVKCGIGYAMIRSGIWIHNIVKDET